jgi:hypothetical protein
MMIDFINIENLKKNGFTGFKTVKELWFNRKDIPKNMGVYCVINPDRNQPHFINPGACKPHDGENPNVSIETLQDNYINDSQVIYIGKAGSSDYTTGLRQRVGAYLGCSKPGNTSCSHAGGRYIWQLKNYEDLIFCWKSTTEEPRNVEAEMLRKFSEQFDCNLPFANLEY